MQPEQLEDQRSTERQSHQMRSVQPQCTYESRQTSAYGIRQQSRAASMNTGQSPGHDRELVGKFVQLVRPGRSVVADEPVHQHQRRAATRRS